MDNKTSNHTTQPKTQTRQERKTIHIRQNVLLILLTGTLLVGIFLGIALSYLYVTSKMGALVSDESQIAWFESTKPNAYSNAKQELSKLIERETGFLPDVIAFTVDCYNVSLRLYTVTVYYELGNRWFVREFECADIFNFNRKLDSLLFAIWSM